MTVYRHCKLLLNHQPKMKIVGLIAMIFMGMLIEMTGVGLIVPVIAVITNPKLIYNFCAQYPYLAFVQNISQVTLIQSSLFGLLIFYVVKTLYLIYMLWMQNKFFGEVNRTLSVRLLSGYMAKSWSFHLQRNSAQLIHNVGSEVNVLIGGILQPGILLLTEVSVLLGVSLLLLRVEFLGSIVVIGVMGASAWIFQKTSRKYLLNLGKIRHYHDGSRMQQLHQAIGGVKDIKLLGREAEFIRRYDSHNTVSLRSGHVLKVLTDIPRLGLELFAVFSLSVLVFVMLFKNRPMEQLLPTLGFFAAASFRLLPSVNRILGAVYSVRYSLPVLNTLAQELHVCQEDIRFIREKNVFFPLRHSLVVEQVQYEYAGAHEIVIPQMTISISRGTSVAFIGSSGAGKSTLVDIILGLLEPTSGSVKVDGVDIRTNIRAWQDQIGYVPQSIYLTDDSLRRNIAFGLADDVIDDIAVMNAVRAAQLDVFVENLPDGLNTIVGERGVRLSGGQRQRIGIARALYHNPSVLVLDEATSALDYQTEKGVMEAIQALHGQKTILIVAHRLSTVAHCDVIYRLESGQIVDSGSFDAVVGAVAQEG